MSLNEIPRVTWQNVFNKLFLDFDSLRLHTHMYCVLFELQGPEHLLPIATWDQVGWNETRVIPSLKLPFDLSISRLHIKIYRLCRCVVISKDMVYMYVCSDTSQLCYIPFFTVNCFIFMCRAYTFDKYAGGKIQRNKVNDGTKSWNKTSKKVLNIALIGLLYKIVNLKLQWND